MAYFSFTRKLLNGEKIRIFNYGNYKRDFVYIDDIARVMQGVPERTVGQECSRPILTLRSIWSWEQCSLGRCLSLTPDISQLERDYEFRPKADLRTGLRAFAEWYKEYYGKIIT